MKLPSSVMRKIADWYRLREESADADQFLAEQEKRRKTRMRLYECEDCGKKLRAADDYLAAAHMHVDPDTHEETWHPFLCRTPLLTVVRNRGRLTVTAPF